MKLVSWNVNGLRACVKKGFLEYFHDIDADIFCIQETKLQEGQIDVDLPGYLQYWNYAEKKGYSGTAVFTKYKPLTVSYGFSPEESEREGRIITLEYENFYLVNVYTPNSQRDLARLKFRLEWEDKLKKYLLALNEKKPVVYCGDLNVAHQEIDLKNAKSNIGNSGFTNEEREKMTSLLASGFIDTFRYLHPDAVDHYTWWSYMNKVRERNIGWRIDYFIVSESIKEKIVNADIHSHVLGSDHCPILLEIDL
ncbi:exodeoxyribonuclease III [Caldibacillus sp. 210928-DFI.2.22]|jgi:exodeoxyribonuclease-3|uniref:exodeoxyribonuclease III n=1 Tax=Bacillaceae TaxID=186817 RepID=UPI000D55E9AB|nr:MULTISPECIES: exodeoxyribonuclease III [Caldibacillus]AWI12508.1 exodeoxyribonuclease III [Caldibacillus thermoamylovorans]MCB7070143.1 exodeoxyribonuclease III [Caldibacillus sp. 210928-DFI.2.22]MCB7073607.1 exodeoxyribonuclease III [Caldibacillus sp. 210928-DFI.2.18]NWN96684.1 exodeoxyribonuclease III [Bacillus sp. (in: firmicutes)]